MGVDSHEDEFYMKWPLPITKDEVEKGHYLKSLSPVEELAAFLQGRYVCFKENQRNAESLVAMAQANRLSPHHPSEEFGLARIVEIVTAGVNPGRPSFRSPQREAAMRAEKAEKENEEQQRAYLHEEIKRWQDKLDSLPKTPGDRQPAFSSGFPQLPGRSLPVNRPFSPFSNQNRP